MTPKPLIGGLSEGKLEVFEEIKCNYVSFIGVITFWDAPLSEHLVFAEPLKYVSCISLPFKLEHWGKNYFITHLVQLLVSFSPLTVFTINFLKFD